MSAYDSKTLAPKFVEIGQIVQMLKSVNKIIYTYTHTHTHNPAFDHTIELVNRINDFI